MARVRQARRCKTRRSDGQPCRAFAIVGGFVCAAHGGSAPQVRSEATLRYWQARLGQAYDRAYVRWRRETLEWQAARILAAASILGISPLEVTEGDVLFCVVEHGLPGEETMPKIRVDGRVGPRTRAQLATRAARQASRAS